MNPSYATSVPAQATDPSLPDLTGWSDDDLARWMTAAVRTYSARCEQQRAAPSVVQPNALTATEVVTVVSELIRAADMNLFDVAMWFRRPAALWAGADRSGAGVVHD
jgi:hypothetical protein